ncbi:MAG: DUF3572 domain-containing protein [Janthinobacterium lividum]
MNNGPNRLKRQERQPTADPDVIAIQALTYIASGPDHAERFMALTGIPLDDLRKAAAESGFLLGVMDYLIGDEALLLLFAADSGLAPEAVAAAHDLMTRR